MLGVGKMVRLIVGFAATTMELLREPTMMESGATSCVWLEAAQAYNRYRHYNKAKVGWGRGLPLFLAELLVPGGAGGGACGVRGGNFNVGRPGSAYALPGGGGGAAGGVCGHVGWW